MRMNKIDIQVCQNAFKNYYDRSVEIAESMEVENHSYYKKDIKNVVSGYLCFLRRNLRKRYLRILSAKGERDSRTAL